MKIENDADRLVMLSAFRYAIGRAFLTSVISLVIVESCDDLTPGDQMLIHKEIKQAVSNGKVADSVDCAFWDKVLELPIEENSW